MKIEQLNRCAVMAAIALFRSKWKPIVLYHLNQNDVRYGDLWRAVPKISRKVLSATLRELVADGLVNRSESGPPPRPQVRYQLTEKGLALTRIFEQLEQFGKTYLPGTVSIEDLMRD